VLGLSRRQFARPRGLRGLLAGELMAWSNRAVNRWTLDQLGVGRRDRVLELGSGAGVGLELAARRARRGLVAGLDLSPAMVRRAGWRNRRAARAGRLQLRAGSASALPWPDGAFTRAFSVNTANEWPDRRGVLAELHRVLAPGGMLAITTQQRTARSEEEAEAVAARTAGELAEAGFSAVRLVRSRIGGHAAFCFLAVRPASDEAASG
jgi:ubiquinone/menaquinone biosynthesis C-methylase UbiE